MRKKRPKRTGGGDGGTFAELARQIYQDERADAQARVLLLATAYAVTMAPLDDETTVWRAISDALTLRGWNQLRAVIRTDIPRYERPDRRTDPLDRLCSGPRIRPHLDGPDDFRNKLRVCGTVAERKVVVKDPRTGWHTNRWFCSRHQDEADRVRQQVREQNEYAPEPIPNRGGLMPVYFDCDWVELYRWSVRPRPEASAWGGQLSEWTPPTYGVCADAWPIPGKDPVPTRPRLRLLAPPHLDDETEGTS
ncbi:hypothetical protein [Streptomyces nanshensis]|uniref:hypothetical protein n=1 Tax=Streptomyces nanshensis TaxID=518642 RepID=UPI00114D252E|nr:hypothetical protein [Streptomyces nanshensis]